MNREVVEALKVLLRRAELQGKWGKSWTPSRIIAKLFQSEFGRDRSGTCAIATAEELNAAINEMRQETKEIGNASPQA